MSPRGQDVPAQVAWLASLLGLVLSCSAVVLRDFFFLIAVLLRYTHHTVDSS